MPEDTNTDTDTDTDSTVDVDELVDYPAEDVVRCSVSWAGPVAQAVSEAVCETIAEESDGTVAERAPEDLRVKAVHIAAEQDSYVYLFTAEDVVRTDV